MQDSEELIKKWDLLKKSMESTENYILMRIDMARNKLLTAGKDLFLTYLDIFSFF